MLILPLSIVLLRMVASQSGIIRDNQALTNDPTVISMALYIYIYTSLENIHLEKYK